MNKTSLGDKLGYGIASLGDAVAYGLTSTFLMFFFTTVAGISPGIAGAIVAFGSVWNAVINPIIGYYADKVRTRYGRRRPMIFIFSFPLFTMLFLLFTDVNIPMGMKPVYYGILIMLYWTFYTGFFIPYLALGAEYTADYDDRTVLRLFVSLFNLLGFMLSLVLPTKIVDIFESMGLETNQAWSAMVLMLSVIAEITILVTLVASRKKDLPCVKEEQEKNRGQRMPLKQIFAEFITVAALKPMKYLILASLFSLVGYTMLMSDMVYFLTYNNGLSSGSISLCMLIRALFGILIIPIVGKLVIATDRKNVLIGTYVIGAIGMCAIKFMGISTGVGIAAYMVFLTLNTSVYWQVAPGIFYDVCEYDRIVNGKSRSATIVSFQGFVEALAVGIGGQLLGLILDAAGFDGSLAVQGETALVWIENSGTIVPVIFLLLSAAALYKYPINRETYNEMLKKEN